MKREGFSKISYNIFQYRLKSIDIIVYCFYLSHMEYFVPSFQYTRRVLRIHLHTLKNSLGRVNKLINQENNGKSNFFFIPNFIFELPLSRAEMAILIMNYSCENNYTYSIIDVRKHIYMSTPVIQKSLQSLEKKGYFHNPLWKIRPKKTLLIENPHRLNYSQYQKLISYYEYLKFKIGQKYKQEWEQGKVLRWKIDEVSLILEAESKYQLSLKDLKGIIGLKALVLYKSDIVASKISSAFELRYLLSPKNLTKNYLDLCRYKETKNYKTDSWYVHSHIHSSVEDPL